MLHWGLVLGILITLLVFIGGCIPGAEPEGEGTSSVLPMVIFLVIIFGAFYFLTIRPQRRKRKEHQDMVQELRKGVRVITAGGIYGQIENLNDESVVLKIESGATIRIARSSVVGRLEK